jgi:NADH-quinone oxidoreductase subunit D
MARQETMTINMGPHHPSTHGVLRIILTLDGETVIDALPDIGYLHRGIEKLAEERRYHQVLPLTDRLDYLSSASNNLGYILAVEKLFALEAPRRARWVRTLFAELSRISSHLLWLGTHAADLGAMTVLLYAMQDRERVLDLIEECAGQRLMVTWFRAGGIARDLPAGLEKKVKAFLDLFLPRVDEYEALLTGNRIWRGRTVGIGAISSADAMSFGVSGPALRASGVDWDIRRDEPYEAYDELAFAVPLATEGDVYSRYLVRVAELRQSALMVRQLVEGMPEGPFLASDAKAVLPARETLRTSMEAMVHHFELVIKGAKPPVGEVYSSIEAPKGELGFWLVSDGSPRPYRLRIRPPSFINLQALRGMVRGCMLADVVAIIGSIDIILGEIDR